MPDPVVRSLSSQLRTLARLAAQWADVLDTSGEASPTRVASPPLATQSAETWPKVTLGLHSSAEPVPEVTTAVPSTAPVFFRCPQCNRMKEWRRVDKKPWPNAVCSECYAFNEERNDQRIAEVEGYTGVR